VPQSRHEANRGAALPVNIHLRIAGALFAIVAARAFAQDPQLGAPLPPWTPGTLDIHQIATGRGNAALFILPDGTSLLVDAGAAGDGIPQTEPHPDATRAPGAWIARYLTRHLPGASTGLDYAMITHFHPDHMGQLTPGSPVSKNSEYRITGIIEVDEALPIHMLIDRGWPDYSYPAPLSDETMTNYRRFLNARTHSGLRVERFQPGSATQIRLLRDASKYPSFEIRNIVGNGEMWTGVGAETRHIFPDLASIAPSDRPNENMCSLAFRLQYGRFRYFTGGDLPGTPDPGFPAWHAPEALIASVVGPVDVNVVNQHGSMGEESEAFLKALQSSVFIVPSWAPSHPAPDVLKRIMNSRLPPANRLVFVTDLRDAARIVIGQRATQLAGPPGHIVVRVDPGGEKYRIFVLDNHDERDLVVAMKGPFTAAGPARL
jgi:beta-lactamase superfamily II metal-dependent hydrolase